MSKDLPPPPKNITEQDVLSALKLFVSIMRSIGLSEKTIKSYVSGITDFASFAGNPKIKDVDVAIITEWINSRLKEGFERKKSRGNLTEEEKAKAQTTLHYYTIFLRKFLKWAGIDGRVVPIVKKPVSRAPRTLDEKDIDLLYNASKDINDLLIVSLLFETGIRASELLGIKVNDIDLEKGEIRIRGKYGKERIVFLGPTSKEILKVYLMGKKPTEKLLNITYNALYKRIRRLAKRAGLKNISVRPHVLRHTFATQALKKGVNLIALQNLLGHTDIKTTQIYIHLLKEDLRREYEKIFYKKTENSTGTNFVDNENVLTKNNMDDHEIRPLYCYKCGFKLPDQANFCPRCGTKVILLSQGEIGQEA